MSALLEKNEAEKKEKTETHKRVTTSPSRGVYLYKLI